MDKSSVDAKTSKNSNIEKREKKLTSEEKSDFKIKRYVFINEILILSPSLDGSKFILFYQPWHIDLI